MSAYNTYPVLEVDLKKLRHNAQNTVEICKKHGISVAGVIKGTNGLSELARVMAEGGVAQIASSRLEQLARATERGIDLPKMLIRIPMISEAAQVVKIAQISLQSEIKVLRKFDEEARKAGLKHKVILMLDMGDLREGFWDREDALEVALEVENKLAGLELAGVGSNFGCYGSVIPTQEKLEELVDFAKLVEEKIGRKLEFVSGGGSNTFPRILENKMPAAINHMRIGEHILHAREITELWGHEMKDTYMDSFTIKAEIVELKNKPTFPVGERKVDAFGETPVYVDRGIRKRAILAIGRVDYGAVPQLMLPKDKGVEIIGASSDHTIVDIEDAERDFEIGDIMEFVAKYAPVVYSTISPSVNIIYKDEKLADKTEADSNEKNTRLADADLNEVAGGSRVRMIPIN